MKKNIFNTIVTSNNSYTTTKPVFNDNVPPSITEEIQEFVVEEIKETVVEEEQTLIKKK